MMKTEIALELIKQQIGSYHNNDPTIIFRHLSIKAKESLQIEANNQIFYLLEEPELVSIESERGLFNTDDKNHLEQTHIHSGIIRITSNNSESQQLRFIQLIL